MEPRWCLCTVSDTTYKTVADYSPKNNHKPQKILVICCLCFILDCLCCGWNSWSSYVKWRHKGSLHITATTRPPGLLSSAAPLVWTKRRRNYTICSCWNSTMDHNFSFFKPSFLVTTQGQLVLSTFSLHENINASSLLLCPFPCSASELCASYPASTSQALL